MKKNKKVARVLLIEDDPGVVELFRGFLEDNVLLYSAANAEEARDLICDPNNNFDFIFVDALLPPNGLASSLQLVRDFRGECPPILVGISANLEYALMLKSAGCHRWLEKDSTIGERVVKIIKES